jgi:hypothetical protein
MRRLLLITGLAAMALATPVARAATADQTLAVLNAQRAANGLPAGLTLDATWSADCTLHDHYMAINNELTHVEDPSNKYYTAGGAFAGPNSVISRGGEWDHGNPYESAPIHLEQLLAPRLQSIGTADAEGYTCTTTFPGWTRPDPPALTVYTYPGDGAQIYASESAAEGPWTPGDLVGIAQPAITGPYLYVLVDAPGQNPADNPATLSGVTLTGPSGPVAFKTVDGNQPIPGGGTLAGYLSPGGFIIPVAPLAAGASYHAHVVVTFGGQTIAHDWTFTTGRGKPPPPPRTPSLRFGVQSIKAGRLHVALNFGPELKGRRATLTITQLTGHCQGSHCTPTAGSSSHRTITLGPTTTLQLSRPAKGNGLRLTLDTAAFQQGGKPWTAAHAHVDIIWRK